MEQPPAPTSQTEPQAKPLTPLEKARLLYPGENFAATDFIASNGIVVDKSSGFVKDLTHVLQVMGTKGVERAAEELNSAPKLLAKEKTSE